MNKSIKFMLVAALALSLMVGIAGCGSKSGSNGSTTKKNGPKIVVGSKTFTEALLLGSMTYQYLQHLGYPVENKTGLGELAVIRPALTSKQINAYWEYTGTVLIEIMKHEPSFNEKEAYQLVKDYDAKNNIVWLDYAPFDDTYGIMVRKDIADKYNLKTTSDLMKVVHDGAKLRFISTQEMDQRSDGIPHFMKVYGNYPKNLISDAALNIGYEALKNKQAEVGVAFTTDARVKAYNLVMLKDDKNCWPVYNPAPLFRKEIIDAYPDLPAQMKKLSSLLDNETIMELNKQVDIDKKSVDQVAKDFLTKKGLI